MTKMVETDENCGIPVTCPYHCIAFHEIIVSPCADDSTMIMPHADPVEREWTLNDEPK